MWFRNIPQSYAICNHLLPVARTCILIDVPLTSPSPIQSYDCQAEFPQPPKKARMVQPFTHLWKEMKKRNWRTCWCYQQGCYCSLTRTLEQHHGRVKIDMFGQLQSILDRIVIGMQYLELWTALNVTKRSRLRTSRLKDSTWCCWQFAIMPGKYVHSTLAPESSLARINQVNALQIHCQTVAELPMFQRAFEIGCFVASSCNCCNTVSRQYVTISGTLLKDVQSDPICRSTRAVNNQSDIDTSPVAGDWVHHMSYDYRRCSPTTKTGDRLEFPSATSALNLWMVESFKKLDIDRHDHQVPHFLPVV